MINNSAVTKPAIKPAIKPISRAARQGSYGAGSFARWLSHPDHIADAANINGAGLGHKDNYLRRPAPDQARARTSLEDLVLLQKHYRPASYYRGCIDHRSDHSHSPDPSAHYSLRA